MAVSGNEPLNLSRTLLVGRANQQEVVLIFNRTQVAQFAVTLLHRHLHRLGLPS
jgi:hypothetical protein